MVLLDKNSVPSAIYEFEANVTIMQHGTTIKPNYEAVVHCGVIRQAAKVVSMEKLVMRLRERGIIKFCFKYRPEFIKEGQYILFREGLTKGFGVITRVYPSTGAANNL